MRAEAASVRAEPTVVVADDDRDWFDWGLGSGDDYHAELARLRMAGSACPLRLDGLDESLSLVVAHDAALAILRDDRAFDGSVVAERYGEVLGERALPALPATERLRIRRTLRRCLSLDDAAAQRSQVKPAVEAGIDRLRRLGSGGGPVDLVRDYAEPVALATITGLLDVDEIEAPEVLAADVANIARLDADRAGALAAAERLKDACLARLQVVRRRASSSRLAALSERLELADDELVNLLIFLLWAGVDTSAAALATVLFVACYHERVRETLLLDDPQPRARALVDEILRWESPVQLTCRSVRADTTVAGAFLPAGSLAIVHLGSANRDGASYDRPDEIVAGREARSISFGYGAHYCLGAELAGMMIGTAVGGVLRAFPCLRLALPAASITGQMRRAPDHLRAVLA